MSLVTFRHHCLTIWDNPFFKTVLILFLYIIFLFGSAISDPNEIMQSLSTFLYLTILSVFIIPFFIGIPQRISNKGYIANLSEAINLNLLPTKDDRFLITGTLLILFGLGGVYGLMVSYGAPTWTLGGLFGLMLSFVNSGFWEEVIFRGFIYHIVRTKFSIRNSIIFTSILFGIVHMSALVYYPQITDRFLPHYLNQAIYASLLGVIFNLLIEKTGSLWSSVIVHYSINLYLNALFTIDYVWDFGIDFWLRLLFLGILPLFFFIYLDKFLRSKEKSVPEVDL